jgi:hypothetical protein
MARIVRCTPGELPGLIAQDLERLTGRIKIGLAGAAIDGAHIVAQAAPVAFGELRHSIRADVTAFLEGKTYVRVSAPHAGAVEEGSRPHHVPLEALIRWVKLRGAQGITARGKVKAPSARAWGSSTARHAHVIASQIHAAEKDGSVELEAITGIAKAIQDAIAKHGTKPHWFVRSSLPKLRQQLDRRMKKAVRGQ